MFLEQRVEQLENLTVDHMKQIETIANGLGQLTTDMSRRFDRVENRLDRLEAGQHQLVIGQAELNSRVSR